jgi:hypothetical protein
VGAPVGVRRDRLTAALVALGLCAAAATAGGLLLGARSFLSNLLAELAGFALSVVVAVVIIEKLAEQRRRRRWDLVRDSTLRGIQRELSSLLLAALAALPGEPEYKAERAVTEPPERLIASEIRSLSDSFHEEISPVFHRELRGAVARLSALWLPRVLELANDPRLAKLLLDIEWAEWSWAQELSPTTRVLQYKRYDWSAAARLYDTAADLVVHLDSSYDLDNLRHTRVWA